MISILKIKFYLKKVGIKGVLILKKNHIPTQSNKQNIISLQMYVQMLYIQWYTIFIMNTLITKNYITF